MCTVNVTYDGGGNNDKGEYIRMNIGFMPTAVNSQEKPSHALLFVNLIINPTSVMPIGL